MTDSSDMPAGGATAGLLIALLVAGTGLGGFTVAAAERPGEIVRFEEIGLSIHPLGEGIWRHVTTTVMESGRPVPANGLIVTSNTEALLIDTGWNAAQTGALLDDLLTVMVGDRRVELYYPGAGHAPDNIVAWVPDRRLLFGGCLVKSAVAESLGYRGDADLAAWPGSIAAVRARFPDAALIVPGHGEPGSTELYTNTLRLLEEARP